MNVTTADLAAAGRLIGWAARPRETPVRVPAYRELVARYADDGEFRITCDAVAAGLGLTITVDRLSGIVAVSEPDGPLRMTMADFTRRTNPTHRRALNGIVLLGIAHTAFPDPSLVDDTDRVAVVSVAAVVDFLNRVTGKIAEGADDRLAGDPARVEMWRAWDDLPQARPNQQRDSMNSRSGLVRKLCKFLEEEGHLREQSPDVDGGTYQATQRFRVAVRDLLEDSDMFIALHETTSAEVAPDGSATS